MSGQSSAMRRLSSEQSHAIFRVVLDALARPGCVGRLSVDETTPPVPPVVLPALALADLEVSVAATGDGSRRRDADATDVDAVVRRFTGARTVRRPADADIVIVLGRVAARTISQLRRGSANQPESGARLFLACRRVVNSGRDVAGMFPETRIWIKGPGAPSGRIVDIDGIDAAAFEAIRDANASFPAGIDTWMVAADATMVAIPRSCRVEVVALS